MATVTIEDDQNDEEISSVLSPQDKISLIHSTTPDTLVVEQKKTLESKELVREKQEQERPIKETHVETSNTSQEGPHVSRPQDVVNKENREEEILKEDVVLSATISSPSIEAQARPRGDISSPSLTLAVPRSNTPKKSKGKKFKDNSLDITISLVEVIDIPKWNLANLTFEKTVTLQEILAKKKKQEEMRKKTKQKKVLHDIKNIFIDTFDIKKIDEKAPIIS